MRYPEFMLLRSQFLVQVVWAPLSSHGLYDISAMAYVPTLVRQGSHDIVDGGDRARSYSTGAHVRTPLDQIGFWHGNRGSSGVIGYHIHRICQDILKHGTNLHRYNHVGIVEIPPHRLERIMAINRARCKTDKFMPRFSDQMRYVCLYKTHFTHMARCSSCIDEMLYMH